MTQPAPEPEPETIPYDPDAYVNGVDYLNDRLRERAHLGPCHPELHELTIMKACLEAEVPMPMPPGSAQYQAFRQTRAAEIQSVAASQARGVTEPAALAFLGL